MESYLLHTEESLRRSETQQGGSHVRTEEIRIEKELCKTRWGHLRLSWQSMGLRVEKHMLYHPTLSIDFLDPL